MKKQFLKSTVALLGAAFFSQVAMADDSARDLFFNPSKAIIGGGGSATTITTNNSFSNFTVADNDNLGSIDNYYADLENPGVQYSIELLRRGSNTTKRVDGNHVFKAGDRIRIHVTTNGNGYMHALHKGSTGDSLLVPISSAGQVINGQDITIPSSTGWLRFDENTGVEKVDLVFASHAVSAQEAIVPTPSNNDSLIVAIRHVVDTYTVSKDLVTFVQPGEKDLIVENGAASFPVTGPINRTGRPAQQISQEVYSAPANYAVNTAGKPVVVKISLKHQ